MTPQERREEILQALQTGPEPLTGSDLAERFAVSRQVIVQDIALLRARGEAILATPQGYLLVGKLKGEAYRAVLACQHAPEEMEQELSLIVSLGGKVLDVMVEHPIYGELKGMLMISSLKDVSRFMEDVTRHSARPLSALTDGVHLHTVEAPDAEAMEDIKRALHELGCLMPDI
jgi:uncharacterized protein